MNGDPWSPTTVQSFDASLVASLRKGPLSNRTDVEAAIALAALVHDELLAYGTGGGESLNDGEMASALTALRAVTKRLGVDFDPPYRNFSTFRSFWMRNDGYGSWQARRDLLEGLFEPLHLKLVQFEERTFDALADPASPRTEVGWPLVDEEVRELRRRFQTAATPQDYRDVGNRCVTEMLGDAIYNPSTHLRPGEEPLKRGDTKKRFDRYIETLLTGSEHAAARSLARSVVVFAQEIKHDTTPTRREAGLAADAVILLVNIMRRLDQEL